MNKAISWTIIVVLIGGISLWAYSWLNRPLLGELIEDMGRNHVAVGTAVEYNSNPPTSGPHYAEWTRGGIYDSAPDDGNLIHSLEHGYVIISYRDNGLKDKLVAIANALGLKKLIVTPRENLDVPLALTAWTRILKLQSFDESQIRDFVDTFRNAGPEQTME